MKRQKGKKRRYRSMEEKIRIVSAVRRTPRGKKSAVLRDLGVARWVVDRWARGERLGPPGRPKTTKKK